MAKAKAITMAIAKAKAKAMVIGMTRARARARATREERGTVEGEFIMGREGITRHSFNEMTSRLNYKDNTESLKNPIKRNS